MSISTRIALALAVVVAMLLTAVALPAATASASSPLYLIPLSSGEVDPLRDWRATDPATRDLVLVQFTTFGATEMVNRVQATGAKLVQPLAPVNYIVYADATQTRRIRALDGVRFAGVLPASARIAGSVTPSTTQLRVTVVGVSDLPLLGSLIVQQRAFTAVGGGVAIVTGDAAAARRLAALPRVYSVADAGGVPQLRDEKTVQAVAHGTDAPLAPGYETFLEQYGVDGTGVVLSHVDGGVDQNHPELSHGIRACIDYVVQAGGGTCNTRNHDDAIGHGTHTLGHVLGSGSTGLGDAAGFAYGQGVAPGARAVVQNAINLGTIANDAFTGGYRPVYEDASHFGAIVSQNSWGPSGSPEGYDSVTREFDSMVRDVDDDAAGDQPMALVFSIMNGSGGTSTQGSPDEGKNIIGVGGTGARGARSGGAGPSLDDLCTCTAHGPALDGRLLPTIVAPAENVMSTRASQGTLCGLSADAESTPSPIHAPCTGTSFASPHVTGAYALFVQWYRQHFAEATPSPALVKAALVNGADDLVGGEDADGQVMGPIPNNQQGWGRLNIGNVLAAWTAGTVSVDQSVLFGATGEAHTVQVTPIDPTKPMKATLTWTDALGPGLGEETPAWINDLDLTVAAPDGSTYLGNVFANGVSTSGGEADRRNNLENVYLSQPTAGTHTVTVSAANILGDALPNSGDATEQDFALVITNAAVAP